MQKFMFIYEGGSEPQTPEEGAKILKAWEDWFASMGDKVVDAGFPFNAGAQMTDGQQDMPCDHTELTGYSIIQAESMQEAIKISKSCPNLDGKSKIHIFPELPM